jgi:hypothetical protein
LKHDETSDEKTKVIIISPQTSFIPFASTGHCKNLLKIKTNHFSFLFVEVTSTALAGWQNFNRFFLISFLSGKSYFSEK